jgi:hypothetical protein
MWTVYWCGELFDLWDDIEVLETMKNFTPIRIVYETRVIEF